MKARGRRSIAIVSVGGLLAVMAVGTMPAGAAPSAKSVKAADVAGATPFARSTFSGYSSGNEVGVNALNLSPTMNLAGIVQAFSGASAVSPGNTLSTAITGDNGGTPGTGLLVQPAQPSTVKAFGTGIGASVGLAAAADGSGNQLKVAGQATQVAPPNNPAVTNAMPSASGLQLPAGVLNAALLTGRGAAFYDATSCPLGQPLSYGLGNAANASLLDFSQAATGNPLGGLLGSLPALPLAPGIPGLPGLTLPTTGSLISTSGAGNAASQSDSETFLSSNGDGTFGYTTQAEEVIAPVTVNLFDQAQLVITVSGSKTSQTPAPVMLTAKTTGEATGASVSLVANDFIGVDLVAGGTTTAVIPATSLQQIVGQGGIHLDLNPSTLVTQLGSILPGLLQGTPASGISAITGPLGNALTTIGSAITGATAATPLNASLGTVDIGTPVRAINGAAGSAPVVVGGTQASGAVDILRLHIGITDSALPAGSIPPQLADLADLTIGHLEASANNASPITCDLPVVKTANPTSITAGDSFTYTIQVPDPAKLADLSCSLSNVSATDTISDAQGAPAFNVVGVSNGGTVIQTSPNSATINWSNLTYTVAPVGAPPNPPITLTISVNTPASSPAGIIQDTVSATGTTSGCNGGVSGITNLGGINGNTLTGSFTLTQPNVAAGVAGASGSAADAPQGALPHTGGAGGLWQPLGGLVMLGLGGGALALVHRSRRRMT